MTKSVALGPHLERFVEEQVVKGRYNNESEVMRAGLRLLEKHELELSELRRQVDEGDSDYAAGRYTVVEDTRRLAEEIASGDNQNSAKPRNSKRMQAVAIMKAGHAAGLSADEILTKIWKAMYPERASDSLARACYRLSIAEGYLPPDFPRPTSRR